MKPTKVKMPCRVYVLRPEVKEFMSEFGFVTEDDDFLRCTASLWFYAEDKLQKDYPDSFPKLLPFVEVIEDGRELDIGDSSEEDAIKQLIGKKN